MPDISLILAALLGVAIVFAVLFKPLFREQEGPYFQPDADHQDFSEAMSILEMITELDADFRMGKVSKEDYQTLSLDYKHRYLEAKTTAE